jgi:hypothetical protein
VFKSAAEDAGVTGQPRQMSIGLGVDVTTRAGQQIVTNPGAGAVLIGVSGVIVPGLTDGGQPVAQAGAGNL